MSRPLDALYAYDLAVEGDDDRRGQGQLRRRLVGQGPAAGHDRAWAAGVARGGCWPPGRRAPARRCRRAHADRACRGLGLHRLRQAWKVVGRETVANPGFTRMRFANGLVLDFAQTKLEPNKVDIRLNFGAGRRRSRTASTPPPNWARRS